MNSEPDSVLKFYPTPFVDFLLAINGYALVLVPDNRCLLLKAFLSYYFNKELFEKCATIGLETMLFIFVWNDGVSGTASLFIDNCSYLNSLGTVLLKSLNFDKLAFWNILGSFSTRLLLPGLGLAVYTFYSSISSRYFLIFAYICVVFGLFSGFS